MRGSGVPTLVVILLAAAAGSACGAKTSKRTLSLASTAPRPSGPSGPAETLQLSISGDLSLIHAECSGPFQILSKDSKGILSPVAENTNISLSSSGAITFYTDDTCADAVTGTSIGRGGSGSPFIFARAMTAPGQTLAASAPGTTGASVNLKVSRFTQISSGTGHTCAIVNGGAMCWGLGGDGQLGNGVAGNSLVPKPVVGLSSGVTAISAGDHHTCAIVNGGLKCWGYNGVGQLGNGTTTNSGVPVDVTGMGAGVTAVSASRRNGTCAIQNGGAKCWGDGTFGQLGNNATTSSSVPVQVQGLTSNVSMIAAAYTHSCAIVAGGAMCWGLNSMQAGELGNPAAGIISSVPVSVNGLGSNVTFINTGSGFTCAIQNGALKCWGTNDQGQLGNNSTNNSGVPVQVTGLTAGVTAVAGGQGHACAVQNGGVKCWGDNNNGGLGDTTTTNRLTPVQTVGLTAGATQVGVGMVLNFGCALVGSGVRCWGSNGQGSLGDGTGVPTRAPVRVIVP